MCPKNQKTKINSFLGLMLCLEIICVKLLLLSEALSSTLKTNDCIPHKLDFGHFFIVTRFFYFWICCNIIVIWECWKNGVEGMLHEEGNHRSYIYIHIDIMNYINQSSWCWNRLMKRSISSRQRSYFLISVTIMWWAFEFRGHFNFHKHYSVI